MNENEPVEQNTVKPADLAPAEPIAQPPQEPQNPVIVEKPKEPAVTPETDKGTHGGKREGSGRPPGARNNISGDARIRLQLEIAKHEMELLQVLIDGAVGEVYVLDGFEASGKAKFYKVQPNQKSAQYLLELLAGKAAQPIDHSGEINNPALEKVAQDARDILESLKNK